MSDQPNISGSSDPFSGSTPGTGAGSQESAGAKAQAQKAADELKAAAQAKADELRGRAEEYYGQARERAEEYYGQARDRARTFQDDGEAYIRENPVRAVLTALGAGFVLGILFRR
jgi:ElaB/YqjD/DUF883 family membrane-anchored ribosome-binding protein